MTRDELQACKEGYIYLHDQSARLDTINCCLCNVKEIFNGGFEMGSLLYIKIRNKRSKEKDRSGKPGRFFVCLDMRGEINSVSRKGKNMPDSGMKGRLIL